MTIKDRNLTVGMTLVGKYHKQEHKCSVVQGERDKIRYRLEDNREFKSPSAAGMAITGHACDGWVFWSVETAVAPPAIATTTEKPEEESSNAADSAPATAPETAAAPEQKEAPATTAAPEQTNANKSFRRTPNQKGISEGMTRWYCQTCEESFMAPYGDIPLACPQGHKA